MLPDVVAVQLVAYLCSHNLGVEVHFYFKPLPCLEFDSGGAVLPRFSSLPGDISHKLGYLLIVRCSESSCTCCFAGDMELAQDSCHTVQTYHTPICQSEKKVEPVEIRTAFPTYVRASRLYLRQGRSRRSSVDLRLWRSSSLRGIS